MMVKLTVNRMILMLLPASFLSVAHGARYGLLRIDEPSILFASEDGNTKPVSGRKTDDEFSRLLYADDTAHAFRELFGHQQTRLSMMMMSDQTATTYMSMQSPTQQASGASTGTNVVGVTSSGGNEEDNVEDPSATGNGLGEGAIVAISVAGIVAVALVVAGLDMQMVPDQSQQEIQTHPSSV